ncbi:hypothetical protein KSD_14590 [Ktedonobacter sp. SOSP1-85]|nr:hypothetical protein KSD_14590 [Ktedonobacter sp. SOSP1-85]
MGPSRPNQPINNRQLNLHLTPLRRQADKELVAALGPKALHQAARNKNKNRKQLLGVVHLLLPKQGPTHRVIGSTRPLHQAVPPHGKVLRIAAVVIGQRVALSMAPQAADPAVTVVAQAHTRVLQAADPAVTVVAQAHTRVLQVADPAVTVVARAADPAAIAVARAADPAVTVVAQVADPVAQVADLVAQAQQVAPTVLLRIASLAVLPRSQNALSATVDANVTASVPNVQVNVP